MKGGDETPPTSGEAGYAKATEVFNTALPLHPAAAVTVRSVEEARAAVRRAAAKGLAVRTHTTGHSAGSGPDMASAMLVRTRIEGRIEVDAASRSVRLPAGSVWGDIVDACAAHGLAVPHGSSPTVGAVGYLLRGGLSSHGRLTGVAANSLRAVELVTSDGRARRVDAASDPDLLWALRGGGGGLGVVTSVEVDLFPVSEVFTGAAFWRVEDAHRLAPLWTAWARGAPRNVTTSLRVMRLPDSPDVPQELRARPVFCVDGAAISTGTAGPEATATAGDLLGPLRAAARPVLDTWRKTDLTAVPSSHMDPVTPLPLITDHMLLRGDGGQETADFLEAALDGSCEHLANVELRQLGGALADPDVPGGALDRFDAAYAYVAGGVPVAGRDAVDTGLAHVRRALSPWDTGRAAPTFSSAGANGTPALAAEHARALASVRERTDPLGLFRDDTHAACT
ncbi:FAD-binding protein [Nocardiopsis sp. B62]|uniref:FAD-binding protein n=1 Tax=Nocardiopsis sp. B62 TaxID=2824874 RepID=UPI001B374C9A|nr:FAD-binding protein [Nocardiopsis sp. B62]MBQ1080599.1 FAD-binding protein [Nocardiopsis sp. B62]